MMERLADMPIPDSEKSAEARCRDCGGNLPPPDKAAPPNPSSPDQYCPRCAEGIAVCTACPHCGSLVCSHCGTPVELVDELGIG